LPTKIDAFAVTSIELAKAIDKYEKSRLFRRLVQNGEPGGMERNSASNTACSISTFADYTGKDFDSEL